MAGERILPGLGLLAYWTPGSNGWDAQHSGDLRKLSALAQLSVISRVTSLPGSPLDGAIYIVPAGDANGNSIAIWDYSSYDTSTPAWIYFQPTEGMIAYVQDEDAYYRWDENTEAWVSFGASAAAPYDFGFLQIGNPASAAVMGKVVVPRAVNLPANFTGSRGHVDTNPGAAFTISVTRNGTQIGTISISTAGAFTFATSGGAAVSLAAGDVIRFIAGNDGTIAGIAATLIGEVA